MLRFWARFRRRTHKVTKDEYTLEEIAKRMRRTENVDQSSLIEFAKMINFLLDDTNEKHKISNNPLQQTGNTACR